MSPQRIVGLVLAVLGIVLFIIGSNVSHSFADQMSNTFRGKFTDSTTWYLLGGIALVVLGAGVMLVGRGGRRRKALREH
jgi:hypothetical protein